MPARPSSARSAGQQAKQPTLPPRARLESPPVASNRAQLQAHATGGLRRQVTVGQEPTDGTRERLTRRAMTVTESRLGLRAGHPGVAVHVVTRETRGDARLAAA